MNEQINEYEPLVSQLLTVQQNSYLSKAAAEGSLTYMLRYMVPRRLATNYYFVAY